MNPIGCAYLGLSAFMFSIAHWGKPMKADMVAQIFAAIFLAVGLAVL